MGIKKFIFQICSFIVIFIIAFVCFINYYNKSNDSIAVLNDTIEQLEETLKSKENKATELEEQIESKDIKIKNLSEFNSLSYNQKLKNKETYKWMEEAKWKKTTLTDYNGMTLDITDHPLFIKGIKIITDLNYFEPGFTLAYIPLYTYNFYYENGEEKNIAISFNGGMGIHVSNKLLYDLAIALMPTEDLFSLHQDSMNYALINAHFYICNVNTVIYDSIYIRYLVMNWIPKNTRVVNKLPEDIGGPTQTYKGYLHSKNLYIKIYDYNGIEGCYIECTFGEKTIYYEKVEKNNDNSVYHVFSMTI